MSPTTTVSQVRQPNRRRPVRQPSLAVQTEQILHEQLVSGELAPGDQLPPEHELARQFQVSRATIRSAITALVQRGLVVQRHGVGNFAAAGAGLTNDLAVAVDLAALLDRQGTEYEIVFDDVAIRPASRHVAHQLAIDEGDDVVVAAKRFIADGVTVVYVVNDIAVVRLGDRLAAEIVRRPEITEPLFSFLEAEAGLSTTAQLARLHAELECDIDHPQAATDTAISIPVLRIDETGLDEHQHPIWFSRTWFPPGAMSFELMRHRSRTFP
jgi:GntR family transcriptional regulator